MIAKEFKISLINNTIILEKNNKKIAINKAPDNDIWFESNDDKISFELRYSSLESNEWQTFDIFNNLMKSIIGRFYLSGDNEKEFSTLPCDFINIETKTITWHSDSGTDNVLQLQYLEDIIKITITKAPKENAYNRVRIRTDGSNYDRYHQEFTKFYNELLIFAFKITEREKRQELHPKTPPVQQEAPKHSLLKIFSHKKQ